MYKSKSNVKLVFDYILFPKFDKKKDELFCIIKCFNGDFFMWK